MGKNFIFKRNKYFVYYLLLFSFVLLKVARGMNSEASSLGGLWNYIQISFVITGFIVLFTNRISFFCIKILFVFAIWNCLVSLCNLNSELSSTSDWFLFLTLPIAPCVLLIFYRVTTINDIEDNLLLALIVFFVVSFILYKDISLYRINALLGDDSANIMTSSVYFLVALLPSILIWCKIKWSFIPFLILFFLSILSGKRGAIISVAIMAFVFYSPYFFRKGGKVLKLIAIISIVISSIYLITYVDDIFGTRSVERLNGISDDGGSGRTAMWKDVISSVSQSGILQILFGHGFNSIFSLLETHAHNDFLDILYSYGMFSFILLILVYWSLIYENIRMFKLRYPHARLLTCVLLNAIICSMVSYYFIDNTFIVCGMFSCGLLLGDWSKYKRNCHYGKTNNLR